MQGLFYLLAIVAVSVVFYWFVRNDRKAGDGRTRGLLAYKDTASQPLPEKGKKKRKKGRF